MSVPRGFPPLILSHNSGTASQQQSAGIFSADISRTRIKMGLADDLLRLFGSRDPYVIFSVDAKVADLNTRIKRAFYRLAKIHHPDKSVEDTVLSSNPHLGFPNRFIPQHSYLDLHPRYLVPRSSRHWASYMPS